jgi:hypothetical protein
VAGLVLGFADVRDRGAQLLDLAAYAAAVAAGTVVSDQPIAGWRSMVRPRSSASCL